MAKNIKGGLGKGLGSLMGGSYDEVAKQSVPAQSPRVLVDNPSLSVTVKTTKPEPPKDIKTEASVPIENTTLKSVSARNPEELPITSIIPNPKQPRTAFNEDELEELANSIENNGLLQPILVRPVGENKYEIIAGERRYRACVKAGLEKVPVRVREASDDKSLELAIVENIQRADLNPIEEAYGYRRLMDHKGMTQSEVAQLVSKGRSTIANALRLLDLPEDAQQLLYEGKITSGHARAILSIPSAEGKQKLTEKLITGEGMTVREAEAYARLLSVQEAPKSAEPKAPTPKSYKKVARELRTKLNTSVKIKTSQGRNRIEIDFADETDLERIFTLLVSVEQNNEA